MQSFRMGACLARKQVAQEEQLLGDRQNEGAQRRYVCLQRVSRDAHQLLTEVYSHLQGTHISNESSTCRYAHFSFVPLYGR